MKVVIQCAKKKSPNAPYWHSNGQIVKFVACPELCQNTDEENFQHPDLDGENGCSWRDNIFQYNDVNKDNPFGLLRAWELYYNPVYKDLKEKVGIDNLFILSACWGLIPADFLTPNYDVTFAGNASDPAHRKLVDNRFKHFNRINLHDTDRLIFFGSKVYLQLFISLTENYAGTRSVPVRVDPGNNQELPINGGIRHFHYETSQRTNWHYSCAKDFMTERLHIPN